MQKLWFLAVVRSVNYQNSRVNPDESLFLFFVPDSVSGVQHDYAFLVAYFGNVLQRHEVSLCEPSVSTSDHNRYYRDHNGCTPRTERRNRDRDTTGDEVTRRSR